MRQHYFFARSTVAVACALTLLAGCNRPADTAAGADSRTGPGATSGAGVGATGSSANMAATGASGMPSARDAASSAAGAMPSSSALSTEDAKFVKAAAEGGLFEVAVGKLAADKASRPEVRSFGSMLADHHGAANDKLKQLASARAMTLPTSMPAEKQKKVDQLGKLSGAAFDKQFVEMVGIEDHKKDIADFEKASRGAKADDIRAFASETLPTLQAHLAEAQKLQGAKGKS